MTFRQWRKWAGSLPWSFRWFVLLVLFRPVIDQFWALKHVSPFLSPLYIVGVLTPVFCIYGVLRYKPIQTMGYRIFRVWSFMLAFASLFLILHLDLDLKFVELYLKLLLPVYIFLFLAVFVKNEEILDGILTTFLFSTIFVVGLFIYETQLGPVSVQASRGFERDEGGYADIMNYALNISFGLLISFYFFLKKKLINWPLLLIISAVAVALLFKIYHFTSFAAVALLISLFLRTLFKKNKSVGLLFSAIIVLFILFNGSKIYTEVFSDTVEHETEIFQGQREKGQLFHGRGSRWEKTWDVFLGASPVFQLTSIIYSADSNILGNILGNVHNDYFRVIFTTGYIGFILYIIFLFILYRNSFAAKEAERFLIQGALLLLLVFSLTSTPTIYPSMLYIIFAVFNYALVVKHLNVSRSIARAD